MKRYQLAILFAFASATCTAQLNFPGQHWKRYKDPMQAGWSANRLTIANRYADSIGLAAVMIVYKGAVVAGWGDIERKYLCHSMRKSFLSALYGMSVQDGQIDLNSNLDQLGIDDSVHPLSPSEKQATIRELLQARSGIFLPAAYEGNPDKPKRGSHPHGTFWLYNNWDFNVLGTIMERKTHSRFFEDLQLRIARPLEMEDVDSLDIFYKYELERSQIPAYTFKMSTRDLARFGLLYANGGKWKNRQLIKTDWIKESTTPYSTSEDSLFGYGYLWWVDATTFKDRGMYCAAGLGGHRIFVFPKDDLVVVIRLDTYADKSAGNEVEYQLLEKILAAKDSQPVANPVLEDLPPVAREPLMRFVPRPEPWKYAGRYQFEGEWMTVYAGKTGLMMDTQYMGKFYLEQFSESLFRLKDQLNYISFIFDQTGKAVKLVYHDKSIISTSKK